MSKALLFALFAAALPAASPAPRFQYVVDERVPSYEWREHQQVVVGDMLPAEGVTPYPVPWEYGVTQYQYTVVDNVPVLVVDRSTRRIVEVIP